MDNYPVELSWTDIYDRVTGRFRTTLLEMTMNLSELKFGAEKRPVPHWRSSPTEKMRAAVLTAIQNQRVLLDAERNGTATNLTKTVKTVGEDGSVITSVVPKNPR